MKKTKKRGIRLTAAERPTPIPAPKTIMDKKSKQAIPRKAKHKGKIDY